MATGAIDDYHRRNPDDGITLLGPPSILAVFSSSLNPYNLLPYDRDRQDSGVMGLARLGGMLRDEYYDEGYLLTNSFSSALMFYLGRIPHRIGYRGHLRSWLLTESVDPIPSLIHQAQQYSFLMMRQNGVPPTPIIQISPEEREKARQVLEEKECLGHIRIGLAIGAAYGPAKQWPVEHFAELAKECVQKLDARVLLFGTKNEVEAAESIERQVGYGIYNLAGKTTLRQLLALLQQCRVVVANDSGIMHAATAVKTPVVALFGSTDPQKTGPLGTNYRIVQEKTDCSPCFDRTCQYQHYNCLKKILPQTVLHCIQELIVHQEAK